MKKRIGTLRGKPIVEGDENLFNENEINTQAVNTAYAEYITIRRYKPTDLVCEIYQSVFNEEAYRNDYEFLKEIPVKQYRQDGPYYSRIDLSGFKYGEDTTVYFVIRPKDRPIVEDGRAFTLAINKQDEDDDHSSSLKVNPDTAYILNFTANLDEDEGSPGSDYYQLFVPKKGVNKYSAKDILDTEGIIDLRVVYKV